MARQDAQGLEGKEEDDVGLLGGLGEASGQEECEKEELFHFGASFVAALMSKVNDPLQGDNGSLAHFCIATTALVSQKKTMKFLPLLCLLVGASAFAQKLADPPKWRQWELGPSDTIPADKALDTFKIAPGFELQLFAAEPMVVDPCSFKLGKY